MKTFIINLKQASKRRSHIIREANRMNLDFELFEAVDGRSLSEKTIAEKCDLEAIKRHPDWLTKGMIGASLSHLEVYQLIVERKLPYALIVEDDAAFFDGFEAVVNQLEAVISGKEIVLLHYISFAPLQLSNFESVSLVSEHQLLTPMFLKGVGSAASYVITYETAESLYNNLFPVRFAPDNFYDFHQLGYLDGIRCVYPLPAGVVGAKSTIEITNQSALRANFTKLVDDWEVPVLYKFLRNLRLKSIESRSKISITDERSPLVSETRI